MKTSEIILLTIVSILLILIAVLSVINASFPLIYSLVGIGQIFWLITVFKILKSNNKNSETFEEFYEKVTGDKNRFTL